MIPPPSFQLYEAVETHNTLVKNAKIVKVRTRGILICRKSDINAINHKVVVAVQSNHSSVREKLLDLRMIMRILPLITTDRGSRLGTLQELKPTNPLIPSRSSNTTRKVKAAWHIMMTLT